MFERFIQPVRAPIRSRTSPPTTAPHTEKSGNRYYSAPQPLSNQHLPPSHTSRRRFPQVQWLATPTDTLAPPPKQPFAPLAETSRRLFPSIQLSGFPSIHNSPADDRSTLPAFRLHFMYYYANISRANISAPGERIMLVSGQLGRLHPTSPQPRATPPYANPRSPVEAPSALRPSSTRTAEISSPELEINVNHRKQTTEQFLIATLFCD